jgi:ABC-type bacteriocin/lantibiotic exporter with double-glycine peptidase domain
MKILSQLDPEWSGNFIGASTSRIGRWGCTITSISMISDYFNDYKSPAELAGDAHNFVNDLVHWRNISTKFKNFKFVKRAYGTTSSLLPEIKEALKDPRRAVLVEVDNRTHWVVAYSLKRFSGRLAVADPLGGKIVDVLRKYHNITGAAFFEATDEWEKPTNPAPQPITSKLIKSENDPEIYFYNGKKKFHFPNWYSFVELGGDMKRVQTISKDLLNSIEDGEPITNVKPL